MMKIKGTKKEVTILKVNGMTINQIIAAGLLRIIMRTTDAAMTIEAIPR